MIKKSIYLYCSGKLSVTRETGGVRRFKELLNYLPLYCDLTLVSGDKEIRVPNGVHHISTGLQENYSKESRRAIKNFKTLLSIKHRYDAMITFDIPPSVWLAIIGMPHLILMLRKDLIEYNKIQFQERNIKGIRKNIYLNALKVAELITLIRSERICVQCEYDKTNLLRRHKFFSHIFQDKIYIQINNVNPSWNKLSEIDICNAQEGQLTIGFLGDFSSTRKGGDILLEAITKVTKKGFSVNALIAGNGRYLDTYRNKYQSYKNIRFLGRVTNPLEVYAKCNLAVVPSRADSCPNTALEALYLGIPVIGARSGGIPEIINDEQALFELDSEALANKIIEMNDYIERVAILKKQKIRKQELTFDWVKAIYKTLIEDM